MKIEATITVNYTPNTVDAKSEVLAKEHLRMIVSHAWGEGLFTGDSSLEAEDYVIDFEVTKDTPSPSEPQSVTPMNAFKKELKELLAKHNATMWPMMSGDTHGIHDEHVGVSFVLPKKEGDNFAQITEIENVSGEENVSSDNIEVTA